MAAFGKKGIAKLAESALTPADAKKLGITYHTRAATKKMFAKQPSESLKFAYHDINGKLRKDTYRIRLLEVVPGSFGEVPEKPLRYLQPPGSPPAAYFPRILDWSAIAKDPVETIHITEGELKAACACKHGFTTLGLGGVNSWRSKKLGKGMLPELEKINWVNRDVVIIFDADAQTNPQVAASMAALIKALADRGALPRVAALAPVNGDPKTGLDDFVVAKGPEALDQLICTAEGDELATELWGFNSKFSFVLSPGLVYDDYRHCCYDPSAFRNSLFANVWANRVVTRYTAAGPAEKMERVQVAKEWIKWPMRKQFDRLTYDPGKPAVVNGQRNEWSGWGVEPKKGTVKPWKQLLGLLFDGAEPGAQKWFEQWCLYPLYAPGAKMLAAVGIWSRTQGVGKSLVGVTLGRVYGRANHSVISQRELESDFNTWAAKKQFVMVDDVSSHDSRAKADVLKKLITQETLLVNEKYVPTYELPDHVNYYLTSNRSNAFYLEDQDRRFFLHEVTGPKGSVAFFDEYYKWLASGGAAALFWYAQNEMGFDGFNAFVPPPVTKSKLDMIDSARGELDLWLSELANDPDSKLRIGQVPIDRDLLTIEEVLNLFDRTRKGRPVAPNTMGLRMREYFPPVVGERLRVDGQRAKYFIIRNAGKWSKAETKEMIEHVQSRFQKGGTREPNY
jgi:hypothetical protein